MKRILFGGFSMVSGALLLLGLMCGGVDVGGYQANDAVSLLIGAAALYLLISGFIMGVRSVRGGGTDGK